MRILIFLQGTLIMHKNARGKSRAEIIQQVIDQEESVRDFNNYISIGNAADKLKKWASQGAEILYLSALTEDKKARGDEIVGKKGILAEKKNLHRLGFPRGTILHREHNEAYSDVISKMSPLPDILIEDDCESIGGKKEMAITYVRSEIKQRIKLIIVKEFQGIDYLSDNINSL